MRLKQLIRISRRYYLPFLGVLLVVGAQAQPERSITIQSVPSGAKVLLLDGANQKSLGMTGQPLQLPVVPMRDSNGRPALTKTGQVIPDRLRLQISLENHQSLVVELSTEEQQFSQYPPATSEPLKLPASSFSAWATDLLSLNPKAALAIPAALLIGFAALLRFRQVRRSTAYQAEADPWIGRVIENYRLTALLGEGGMGAVYRGEDPSKPDGAPVAIKILGQASDTSSRRRFLRECKVSSALEHPNIVKVFGYGESNGQPYLIMELLNGKEFAQALSAPMPAPEAWKYFKPVFEAMALAHSQSVVHRDLKPSNLFLTQANQVKILDFGIARRQDLSRVTTQTVFGTPHFLAPEAYSADAPDETPKPSLDQYALGVLLYYYLTGRFPYDHEDVEMLLVQHLKNPVPSLQIAGAEALDAVIQKMLAKLPSRRFPDLTSAAAAIEQALSNRPDEAAKSTVQSVRNAPPTDDPTIAVQRPK